MALETNYDSSAVLLSFAVSFLAAYIACNFCEQLRSSLRDEVSEQKPRMGLIVFQNIGRRFYLTGIALSLGGIGIWAMHFIGMHALAVAYTNGTEVELHFNFGISFLSLITVLIAAAFGVIVSSQDIMFGKSKREIIEIFLVHAESRYTIREAQKICHYRLMWIISTQQLRTLLLGGVITGGGVCIMHYVGMLAFNFDGCIKWNYGIVISSVFIAITVATIAFWILFRLLSIFPHLETLRIGASLLMAFAVTGMHYTGMVAATFLPPDQCTVAESTKHHVGNLNQSSSVSFIAALLAANICLWLFVFCLFRDMRHTIQLQAKHLKQAENALCITAHQITTTLPTIASKYIAKHNLQAMVDNPHMRNVIDSATGRFGRGSVSTVQTVNFNSPISDCDGKTSEDMLDHTSPTTIRTCTHQSPSTPTARSNRIVPIDDSVEPFQQSLDHSNHNQTTISSIDIV